MNSSSWIPLRIPLICRSLVSIGVSVFALCEPGQRRRALLTVLLGHLGLRTIAIWNLRGVQAIVAAVLHETLRTGQIRPSFLPFLAVLLLSCAAQTGR